MSPQKPNYGKSFGPHSPDGKHVGGQSFPDYEPVCKPVAPGRRPKGLSGPVHPGFPKPDSPYAQKTPAKFNKTPRVSGGDIRVADQNNDLYKPPRKSGSPAPRRKK